MRSILLVAAAVALSPTVMAQPEPLQEGISVHHITTIEPGAIRIAHDPATGDLYYNTDNGGIYRLSPPYSTSTQVAGAADHGIDGRTWGFTVAPEGVLLISGFETTDVLNTGFIMRGTPNADGYSWATVAETEPYPRSNVPASDHNINAIAISPDGLSLFISSGSRTDHGEVQNNDGTYPGIREVPLTSAILRIPADSENLILPNDETILTDEGFLFADGTRNAFDFAFDAEGVLYAAENSGDRDDGDELNRVLEGSHLGFPWRMGLHDTPQQFPNYDPENDLLLNPGAYSVKNGYFHNDPTYPAPPVGVTFTDPVQNLGPDADYYRDPTDGLVYDGSVTGEPIATFTPHRSPLGLVFDANGSLPEPFTGDGFIMGWTSGEAGQSVLFEPFGDEGEDLLHLEFSNPTQVTATRIVRGFSGPVDAVLVDQTMYVIEISAPNGLWAVDLAGTVANEEPLGTQTGFTIAPNPFTSSAAVTLDLRVGQKVRLDIFDLLGRPVVVLHMGHLAAGQYRFTVDGDALSQGTYVVRLSDEAGTRTQLVTLLR